MSDLSRKKAVPADDDRNLVLVDGDFNDADLDDKIWLFWERNRGLLIGSAAAVFLAGIAYIGFGSLRAYRAERIGADYARAETPELKLAFAERNRGEPLAALAALEAADAAYAKADYAEAAKRYAAAAEMAVAAGGKAPLVTARAAVSSAVCEIRAGRTDEGLKRLNAVADDSSTEKAARLHALFALAEHACGQKDFVKARGFLDRFDREAKGLTGWSAPGSPKSMLIQAFPELVDAAPAAPAVVAPSAK